PMPTTNDDDLIDTLQTIVLRLPVRAKTRFHTDIFSKLTAWRAAEGDHAATSFTNTWSALKQKLLSTPHYFYFIFLTWRRTSRRCSTWSSASTSSAASNGRTTSINLT